MGFINILTIASLLPWATVAQLGLTTQTFAIAGKQGLNNVKLAWNFGEPSYTVARKSKNGDYAKIATVSGNQYEDYNVPDGPVSYKVTGKSGTSDQSELTVSATPSGFVKYDNTAPSTLQLASKIKEGSTYYAYQYRSDANAFLEIVEQTSSDGLTFTGNKVVLTRAQACKDSADGFCKFEAITFVQHPTTKEVVMWVHWENAKDYKEARVAVAWGKPGQPWTFGGSFRPTGKDSRDLSFFNDNGKGYLISATDTNTNLNIYALTADWHKVDKLLITVLKGEKREAPHMIFDKGFYYLFTSTASGWLPSNSQYISAPSVTGPWTKSRTIGNTATYGAQSGPVDKIGNTYVMRANRWAAQWKFKEPANRQIVMPISLQNGAANYHFYEEIMYKDGQGVYGVQAGQIVSREKVTRSNGVAAGSSEKLANNGVETDANSMFVPAKVPFNWDVDLGSPKSITRVHLLTKLVGGSETAYKFNVLGSADGKKWEKLADQSKNTVVGFVDVPIQGGKSFRWVRVDVLGITNVNNGNEADWAKGILEATVFAA
ncbi:putative f5 8 type c domain protein [Venturia nashicola]|uniref:Putative f5-8 type c domain protein n=1 Tax=Venturia nashicola TaxID=86259 RepID=A0A4Z1NMX6_9PEZI|nr:putative f5-8 type c domain protein [Venturia nashicola]TLD19992.1 putative f5 8 type c domain protein [Venturia nashicola]